MDMSCVYEREGVMHALLEGVMLALIEGVSYDMLCYREGVMHALLEGGSHA